MSLVKLSVAESNLSGCRPVDIPRSARPAVDIPDGTEDCRVRAVIASVGPFRITMPELYLRGPPIIDGCLCVDSESCSCTGPRSPDWKRVRGTADSKASNVELAMDFSIHNRGLGRGRVSLFTFGSGAACGTGATVAVALSASFILFSLALTAALNWVTTLIIDGGSRALRSPDGGSRSTTHLFTASGRTKPWFISAGCTVTMEVSRKALRAAAKEDS